VPWLRVIYTGASVRGNGGPDLDIYSVSQLDEPGAVSDEDSRTFAISGRSALVYYGLGSILLTMDQAPFYSWAFPYKLLASFTTD
jgi:hypothetical protein